MILLHYPFDMSHIQWDAWSAIGTIAGAFLTFGAVILTYRTIREMKRQREQSLMPNLILRNGKSYKVHRTAIHPFYMNWTEYKIDAIEEGHAIRPNEFFLDLVNIGIGTAIDIEIQFILKKKEIEKFLSDKGFVFERIDFDSDVIGFHGTAPHLEHPFGSNTPRNEREFRIEYISNDKNGVNLKLPLIYLYTFTTYTALYTGERLRFLDHFKNFPTLLLKIKYHDIANKEYECEYEITLNVTGVTIRENMDNIQGTFDVTKL